jgi:hypothetical protein
MQARKRPAKTENLSLRLDPKTKFILDFVSRINGQSITTIVERAVHASYELVEIPTPEVDPDRTLNWRYFWNPHEGVRTLKLLAHEEVPTNSDEEELKYFVREHEEFFYLRRTYVPNSSTVHVLWPKIDEYRRIWDEHKKDDYWAAGRAMAADLSAAKIEPPPWPPTEPWRLASKRDESE